MESNRQQETEKGKFTWEPPLMANEMEKNLR